MPKSKPILGRFTSTIAVVVISIAANGRGLDRIVRASYYTSFLTDSSVCLSALLNYIAFRMGGSALVVVGALADRHGIPFVFQFWSSPAYWTAHGILAEPELRSSLQCPRSLCSQDLVEVSRCNRRPTTARLVSTKSDRNKVSKLNFSKNWIDS